jgi:hypothetical protein
MSMIVYGYQQILQGPVLALRRHWFYIFVNALTTVIFIVSAVIANYYLNSFEAIVYIVAIANSTATVIVLIATLSWVNKPKGIMYSSVLAGKYMLYSAGLLLAEYINNRYFVINGIQDLRIVAIRSCVYFIGVLPLFVFLLEVIRKAWKQI